MNKWTPGPWTLRLWANDALPPDLEALAKERGMTIERIPLLSNDGCRFVSAPETRICQVDPQGKVKRGMGHKHEDAERDANARLIASAPDLYEALELAREHLDMLYPRGVEQGDSLCQSVHKALAKARGEA